MRGGTVPSGGQEGAPLTDAELIRRYLLGDTEAVDEVDGWIEMASRPYVRRLSHQWEDVAQEARLKIFRLLRNGSFRGESSLKTYLWRVVNNTCIDAVRARSIRGCQLELDERPELVGMSEQQARHDEVACEVADLVLRVLEQVPEHCKKIWRMILEGFSYREMSELLDLSENALRVRALRCRERAAKIREQLLAEPDM